MTWLSPNMDALRRLEELEDRAREYERNAAFCREHARALRARIGHMTRAEAHAADEKIRAQDAAEKAARERAIREAVQR